MQTVIITTYEGVLDDDRDRRENHVQNQVLPPPKPHDRAYGCAGDVLHLRRSQNMRHLDAVVGGDHDEPLERLLTFDVTGTTDPADNVAGAKSVRRLDDRALGISYRDIRAQKAPGLRPLCRSQQPSSFGAIMGNDHRDFFEQLPSALKDLEVGHRRRIEAACKNRVLHRTPMACRMA